MNKRTRDNKNDLDLNEEEEGINNKKLKEDNDSSSSNNNIVKSYENEFESFKLKKKGGELSIKKLQIISKDIGLPYSGRKVDLINRIEQYYNIKIKLEKEVEQQQNNNPFNKSQPILLIKNDYEIPFWKVFRNKSIFKNIFSNFKYSNIFNYSRLYSVNNIYNDFNNCIEIIRDKVKSNSYLAFKQIKDLDEYSIKTNETIEEDGLIKIFESIKDETEENQLFYTQFINNYCNKSIHPLILLGRIVKASNLLALKSFLNTEIYVKSKIQIKIEINKYSDLQILDFLINKYYKNNDDNNKNENEKENEKKNEKEKESEKEEKEKESEKEKEKESEKEKEKENGKEKEKENENENENGKEKEKEKEKQKKNENEKDEKEKEEKEKEEIIQKDLNENEIDNLKKLKEGSESNDSDKKKDEQGENLVFIESIRINDFNIFKELKLGELIHLAKTLYQNEKIVKLLELPTYHKVSIDFPEYIFFSLGEEFKNDYIIERIRESKLDFSNKIKESKSFFNEIKEFQFTDKELNENLFMLLKPLTNWDRHFSKLNDQYSNSNSSNNNNNNNEQACELSLVKYNILELYNNKLRKNYQRLEEYFRFQRYEFAQKDFKEISSIHKEQLEIEKEIESLFQKENEFIEKQNEKDRLLQSNEICRKKKIVLGYIFLLFNLSMPRKKPIEYYLSFKDEKKVIAYGTQMKEEFLHYGIPNNEILSRISEIGYGSNTRDRFKMIMNSKFLIEKPFKEHFINPLNSPLIIANVKSKDMLDLLFKNFNQQFFKDNNRNWKYCYSIEIIEYYEKLMQSLGRKFSFSFDFANRCTIECKGIEIYPKLLSRAISNPTLYNHISNFAPKERLLKINDRTIVKQRAFLSLLELNYFKTITFDRSFTFNKYSYKISRWISDNCISNISKLNFNDNGYTKIKIQLPNKKRNNNNNNNSNNKNNNKNSKNGKEEEVEEEESTTYDGYGYNSDNSYDSDDYDDYDNYDDDSDDSEDYHNFANDDDDSNYEYGIEDQDHLQDNINMAITSVAAAAAAAVVTASATTAPTTTAPTTAPTPTPTTTTTTSTTTTTTTTDNSKEDDDGIIMIILNQSQLIDILYNSNRLDDIFKFKRDYKFSNRSFVRKVGPHIPLSLVEILLKDSNFIKIGIDIQEFLNYLVLIGNLPIIKYLNLNFSHFFTKSQRTKDLKSLLSTAVRYDYPQIAEILFVYIKLTRYEFKKEVQTDFSLVDSLYYNNLW
ncbi:hypothetical protein ACTFIW_001227 [Dictyostelium discoideum]